MEDPVDREDGIPSFEASMKLVLPQNPPKIFKDSNHAISTSVTNNARKLLAFKDFTKETSYYV